MTRSMHERMALHVAFNALDFDGRPLHEREPGTLDSLDKDDARLLLEALGLVAPGGRQVLPDPEGRRDVDGLDGEGFVSTPASKVDKSINDRPSVSTAPPGLRDYVPPPEAPKKLKRVPEVADSEPDPSPDGSLDLGADFDLPADPAPEPEPEPEPKPDPVPALSRPLPTPVRVPVLDLSPALPEHGTPEGAVLLHKGESLCVRCQGAVDRAVVITTQAENHPGADRRRKKPRPAKKAQPARPKRVVREKKPPTTTEKCGRPGGYDAHHARGEHACQSCKAVAAKRQQDYVARKRGEGRPAQEPATEPAVSPAPDVAANTAPEPSAAPEPEPEPVVIPEPEPEPVAVPEPVPDVVPLHPGQNLATDLDDWFAAAQRHDDPAVRRAANIAIAHLIQLRVALDDLARAERRSRTTTHPTAGAQP